MHELIKNIGNYLKVIYVFLLLFFLKSLFLTTEIDLFILRIFTIVTIFSLIVFAFVSKHKGNKISIFYLFAWFFLFFSMIIYLIYSLGIFPENSILKNSIYYGSALEHITLSLALVYRHRSAQLEKETLEKATAILSLESLTERMKPHFLFNSLDVISSLMNGKNRKKADDALLELSNLYHFIIESSTKKIIPVSTEWKFIENYLAIMRLRYDDHFTINWNINPEYELPDIEIPPLTIQPLIENCFKHSDLDDIDTDRKERLKIMVTLESFAKDGMKIVIDNNHARHWPHKNNSGRSTTMNAIQKRVNFYYQNAKVEYAEIDNKVIRTTLQFSGRKNK